MKEQIWVKEIRKGKTEALSDVMKETSKTVYGICYKIIGTLGSKEDIEELVSDTFLKVWNEIEKFDEERGTFKTWIYTLAKYRALDFRRKKEKELGTVSDDILTQLGKEDELRDLLLDLDFFTYSLSEEERKLFIRRFYNGESVEEIAEAMDVSRGNVDTKLWRIRKKVKTFFAIGGKEG